MNEDRLVDVLYVSPERFRASPQSGVRCQMYWAPEVVGYLSRHSVGEEKGEAGGISIALYADNVRRKAGLVHVEALALDIDEAGDVDAVADALAGYAAIVHETFSSTNDDPRCRAWLLLSRGVDAVTYDTVHRVVRAHLRRVGIVVDEHAKDASRLSYSPVRRPGAGYRFRSNDGPALDVDKLLVRQPKPAPRPTIKPAVHGDAYAQAALRRAAENVAHAGEGARNATLNREAYALARLAVDDGAIVSTLSDAARCAGLPNHEIDRTLASALRARRGAT